MPVARSSASRSIDLRELTGQGAGRVDEQQVAPFGPAIRRVSATPAPWPARASTGPIRLGEGPLHGAGACRRTRTANFSRSVSLRSRTPAASARRARGSGRSATTRRHDPRSCPGTVPERPSLTRARDCCGEPASAMTSSTGSFDQPSPSRWVPVLSPTPRVLHPDRCDTTRRRARARRVSTAGTSGCGARRLRPS